MHGQTLAVYRLLDELRARHPDVEIESCSSGGARVDLEILARTDRVWASDSNDALERQTIQRWTALLLPPELIGAHVGPPTVHSSGRTQHLPFRFATALFGHFGIEWDIASATRVRTGRAGRGNRVLQGQARACCTRARWSAPTTRTRRRTCTAWWPATARPALFAYVQLRTSARGVPAPMRLPGLDPARRYRVDVLEPAGPPMTIGRPPGWPPRELTGRVLAEVGLRPPVLAPEQAWLVEVTAVA